MADSQVTVLEGIVSDLANELYQKWYNAANQDQQTEETSKALRENATQTTYWVIQQFMDRFNAAAEALKDK
jgi:C4-type Zn-finger protein